MDHAPQGMPFNALCPGSVQDAMGDAAMEELATARGVDLDAAYVDHNRSRCPMRRAGRLQEIAACAAFLASDEALPT